MTGAGGFIGGHLAVALSQAGASVRGLCRYNSRGDRGTLDWCSEQETDGIEVQFGDLRDPDSIQRAMRGVEVAFHLGAQIAIPYSYLNPRDFFVTNVGGTLNVAQAALGADVGRVVHCRRARSTEQPRRFRSPNRRPAHRVRRTRPARSAPTR